MRSLLVTAALAAAIGLSLSACDAGDREQAEATTANAGDRLERAADTVADFADAAAEKAEAAVDDAAPEARELASNAKDGALDVADATGEAAIRAGGAVARATRNAVAEVDERIDPPDANR